MGKVVKWCILNKKVAKVIAGKDSIEIKSKVKGKTKVIVKAGNKKAIFWVIIK